MAVTDILQFLQPAEAQALKMVAVGQAVEQISKNLGEVYTLDLSSAVDASTDAFTLPFDDTDDLSDRSGIRFIYLRLTGSPTDLTITVSHPRVKHFFFVENNTAAEVTIYTAGGNAGAVPAIGPNSGNICYCDGTNMRFILADARTTAQEINVVYWGKPAASEEIGRFMFTRDMVIAEDTTLVQGRVGTNPAANFDINVKENSNNRATLRISNTGVFSWITTGSGATTIEAGNELIFTAPASVDANIEDIRFAVSGLVTINV